MTEEVEDFKLKETEYICAKGHIVVEQQRVTLTVGGIEIKNILFCTICLFNYVEDKFPIKEIK